MSVTSFFLHRLDGHQHLCNKVASFCYRLDEHKNVRNKVACFFCIGSMDKTCPQQSGMFFLHGLDGH